MDTNTNSKKGALVLIRDAFQLSLAEAQEFNRVATPEDKAQLASAAAMEKGLPQEALGFEMVVY